MRTAHRPGPSGVTSLCALRVRLAAGDLRVDAAAVCADVVARLAATGAGLVLADVVTDDDTCATRVVPDADRDGADRGAAVRDSAGRSAAVRDSAGRDGAGPDGARPDGARPDGARGPGTALHRGRRVDLGTLDGLARLELAVRRAGARLELVGAAADLRALLLFTGLADVLAAPPAGPGPGPGPDPGSDDGPDPGSDLGSDVEVGRETEDAEVVRSDEVRDAADAAVTDLEEVDRPRHELPGPTRLVLGEAP